MTSYTGISILVLDDDDLCRDVAASILRSGGYRVTCASDTHEALGILATDTAIDVALIDVKLPPGAPHGLSFARIAQLRRPELKVVLMSGRTDPREYRLFDPQDVFLPKPFTPNDLLDVVGLVSRSCAPE